MKQCQHFPTFKQRGEWVELQFMAQAALHGYHVLKPWGDSLEYDVAIEHKGHLTRVQVKSSSFQRGTGYYRRHVFWQFPSDVPFVPGLSCLEDSWFFFRQIWLLMMRFTQKSVGRKNAQGHHFTYTPTARGFVANNCRSTYCKIPPFA
jgi:PD-(D/E)XK nuclease superfamily protein